MSDKLDLSGGHHIKVSRLPKQGELVQRTGRNYKVLRVRETYDKSIYTIDLRWEGAKPTTGRIYVSVELATVATE